MGAFSFLHTELGIDLGTANIVIIYNDKEALNMPSMIAMNKTTNKVIAVGDEAREMYGKTHDGIEVIRPLRGGVIADFNAAELMLIEMIKKVKKKTSVFPSSLRLLICIPSGRTQVEERSVREAAERAGAREVKLILEPMAAALGVGINVAAPVGNMIVDIGGGTTEIAVISLGGIVAQASIRAAGDNFNQDIIDYMRRVKDIHIGERSAEKIKIEVGSAIQTLENAPADFEIQGRHVSKNIPVPMQVSYKDVAAAIDATVERIINAIKSVLEHTPPELSSDLYDTGIHLTGGGALLRGLDKRISEAVRLNVIVEQEPLLAVARGASKALNSYNTAPYLI